MASRPRLDQYLVRQGLAPSRSRAQALVMAGKVTVNGQAVTKSGAAVPDGAEVAVAEPDHPYVSRGGLKLAGALDEFELDPAGLVCLDVGASTGGFTDCLLQRHAARVTAVDVGYGQFDWKLRNDERVEVHERINARHMPEDIAPGPFDLIVMDVSFISLTLVIPNLVQRLGPGGRILCLVKPQFEAGREQVGKGGVVRDPAVRRQTVDKIRQHLAGLDLAVLGDCASPIAGPAGNKEFFVLAQAGPDR